MLKAGLITGGASLILALGMTLIAPFCTLCLALLLGLGAGYLAGVFDKPGEQNQVTKSGALAGAIGGAGVLIGQMIGAIINGFMVGPQGVADLYHNLGIQSIPTASAGSYWIGLLGGNLCIVVFSVGIMAGLGAVGGLLWWQTIGKNQTPPMTMP